MKNKLSYLIGAAFIICYTGTFTSCINGVDDEYLELQNPGNTGGSDDKGEEVIDINGAYGQGGDYDLQLTCNGEELGGKLITVATDENNEKATIVFAGTEVDMETAIATAIPGGVGGLISGMGFKYISNSPIPGIKEVSLTNVPLQKKGTAHSFEGESIQPTYTITYKITIENDKMVADINYELTNQTLAGTWKTADVANTFGNETSKYSPLWLDWDSNVELNLGKIFTNIKGKPNGIFSILTGVLSPVIMQQIIGTKIGVENIVYNMLRDVTALPNGGMFASYSYSEDLTNPEYSSDMPHNALRYYYDPEHPEKRIYLEINADFMMNLIGSLIPAPSTRVDYDATKEIGKRLVKQLVPLLQDGIPCDYVIEGDNLTMNIDGVVLRDVLRVLFELLNDEVVKVEVDKFLESLGDYKQNISLLLESMPDALKYADGNKEDGFTGECQYVKLGLKFVKQQGI